MKKIKVFLGGYTNYTNAQNLNCRAIAQHLDKSKFEVYTLELHNGQLPGIKAATLVKVFTCFKPVRISQYLGFLWGIWNCDVAYLPKHELWRFNRFLLKCFHKKSFSTMEGILDDDNMASGISILGSKEEVLAAKTYVSRIYSITSFLSDYNFAHHQIKAAPVILYLGCETSSFVNQAVRTGGLKNIAYIGRLKKRKGIYDFLAVAAHFPQLNFHIFGDGEELNSIEKQVKDLLPNVQLKGVVSHESLAQHLSGIDLHILPSRTEGFPKVILETGAAGVPSILYGDYGAKEWITPGLNGWIVKNVNDIIEVVATLVQHPAQLRAVSLEAEKLTASFDWKVRIKTWEKVIIQLNNE